MQWAGRSNLVLLDLAYGSAGVTPSPLTDLTWGPLSTPEQYEDGGNGHVVVYEPCSGLVRQSALLAVKTGLPIELKTQ